MPTGYCFQFESKVFVRGSVFHLSPFVLGSLWFFCTAPLGCLHNAKPRDLLAMLIFGRNIGSRNVSLKVYHIFLKFCFALSPFPPVLFSIKVTSRKALCVVLFFSDIVQNGFERGTKWAANVWGSFLALSSCFVFKERCFPAAGNVALLLGRPGSALIVVACFWQKYC